MKTQKAMRSEKIQMFDDVAGIIVGAEYVYFVTYSRTASSTRLPRKTAWPVLLKQD